MLREKEVGRALSSDKPMIIVASATSKLVAQTPVTVSVAASN